FLLHTNLLHGTVGKKEGKRPGKKPPCCRATGMPPEGDRGTDGAVRQPVGRQVREGARLFAPGRGAGRVSPHRHAARRAAPACKTRKIACNPDIVDHGVVIDGGMAYISAPSASRMRCICRAVTMACSSFWKRGSTMPETMYCQR